MKNNLLLKINHGKFSVSIIACVIFTLLGMSCKKEKPLQSSGKEENYLVVRDNPGDPTDHAIYEFYKSSGIPCYYNDTIFRRQVGDSAGKPTYFYIRLALLYSPVSGTNPFIKFTLPKDRILIVSTLNLFKNELLNRIPESITIHSVLFVDSLTTAPILQLPDSPPTIDLNAYHGFNTLAIKIVNPDTLSAEGKEKYIASVLKELASKKIATTATINLAADFYNISRNASGNEIYFTDFRSLYPDPSITPEDLGFIYYYTYGEFIFTPVEDEDFNSFLNAVFQYTTADFDSKYGDYPIVQQKFRVVKNMAKNVGFQFSD